MRRKEVKANRGSQKNIATESSRKYTRSQAKKSKSEFQGVSQIIEPRKDNLGTAEKNSVSKFYSISCVEKKTARSKAKKNCTTAFNREQITTRSKARTLNVTEKNTVSISRSSVISTRCQTEIIAEKKMLTQLTSM